jgi:hypothetical protein
MSYLNPRVLDSGLFILAKETTRLLIHNVEPTTYDLAKSTALGQKLGPIISGPENASPKGRQITVSPITDGLVTKAGKVSYWSLVDDNGKRLLAAEKMSNVEFDVTTGNAFTMSGFSIAMPGV